MSSAMAEFPLCGARLEVSLLFDLTPVLFREQQILSHVISKCNGKREMQTFSLKKKKCYRVLVLVRTLPGFHQLLLNVSLEVCVFAMNIHCEASL